MHQDDIRFSIKGRAGLVEIDRPEALNALSFDMAAALRHALQGWAGDDRVSHVVLASAQPRAFCAGGDVRDLHAVASAGEFDRMRVYFEAEYGAHLAVYEFPKPVISLADGIVMGGGAGLMQCSTHMIVTEKSRFAMPESAIGLFPDAGASVFLGRCPRDIALLLGLTGRIIGAADCLMLGLAGAMVPSDCIGDLRTALLACDASEIDSIIGRFRADPGMPPLQAHRAAIGHVFAGDDLAAMRDRAGDLARLKADAFADDVHTALATKCPASMHVFKRLLDMADRIEDIAAALRLDYRLAIRMTERPDFREGVRAVLIDKTHDAVWQPARLEEVTPAMIDVIFDHEGLPSLS